MSFLSKIFGNKDTKSLKIANSYLTKINSLEEEFSKLSDNDLKQKTSDLIYAFEQEQNLDLFFQCNVLQDLLIKKMNRQICLCCKTPKISQKYTSKLEGLKKPKAYYQVE